MKQPLIFLILAVSLTLASCENTHEYVLSGESITVPGADTLSAVPNQWIAFRKDISLKKVPSTVNAYIAADSKYWLWINGEPVVSEGSLKRGPKPGCSYYDEIDLAPYLKKGDNKIALLLWYFGKSGFSHENSGMAQLMFGCPAINLSSDSTWLCRVHPAFGTAGDPQPNHRLSESSILFDARKDIPEWQTGGTGGYTPAAVVGSTLGELEKRPIPQWKDFGIKETEFEYREIDGVRTAVATLPYNMQMAPVVTLFDAEGGNLVKMQTNHLYGGSEPGIHCEYITKAGEQSYENLGWMNGEELQIIAPEGVEIRKIAYRETGYDAEFAGKFGCDDDFFNKFWQKGLRTLYVNMRDTYYDCPDRERAQWWGDVTLLSEECNFAFDTKAHLLTRKGIRELCNWQSEDGSLHSPVPGRYKSELPAQMLASVGRYGFWNYYMNTGDVETIKYAYPAVKRYLDVWNLEENGLTALRAGGWNWGDWGDNKDIRLIQAAWYHMALDAACRMAELCDDIDAIPLYREKMKRLKNGFNDVCWTGAGYRFPEYEGLTDDRVQALAVVSGIAPEEYYPAIFEVFKNEEHASPYMEKYVMEALFRIGQSGYAVERCRKRFSDMVLDPYYTTLWEGWGILGKGFGGGTTNHAWSGGTMIVIVRNLFGINPIEAGYRKFSIAPVDGIFGNYEFSMETVAGTISLSRSESDGEVTWNFEVPKGTTAIVTLPGSGKEMTYRAGKHKCTIK